MDREYDVVLFDLDHTLWDYHRNAEESLTELFQQHLPRSNGYTIPELIAKFKVINDELWADYHNGRIEQYEIRTSRFTRFLSHFNWSDDSLAETLSIQYLETGPRKKNLIPGTIEVLDYLHGTYPLIIITNGFEATQNLKVTHSNIGHYFDSIITSEKLGVKKPSPEIFYKALEINGLENARAIMVGDNLETDIAGARAAGIDAVYFNPDNGESDALATYTITELIALKDIL